jgi:hypothetical protein
MKPLVYYKKSGLHIDKGLMSDYLIKVPTRRNRLDRAGSAGLKMDEKYQLKHSKKGLLYIDHTEQAYVIIPKEFLVNPVGKNCNGVKNTIFAFNVNQIVNEHSLEIIPIPHEDTLQEPYKIGLAGEIRKRFGL